MPTEYKDKISDEDKKVIADAVEEAKKHKDSNDKEELETAGKELLDKIQTIGAKLYEAADKEEAPASEDGDKKADKDEPVEGEVVDEKDDKQKKK
jgi:molecular chaperone DnaK